MGTVSRNTRQPPPEAVEVGFEGVDGAGAAGLVDAGDCAGGGGQDGGQVGACVGQVTGGGAPRDVPLGAGTLGGW